MGVLLSVVDISRIATPAIGNMLVEAKRNRLLFFVEGIRKGISINSQGWMGLLNDCRLINEEGILFFDDHR